MEEDQKSSDGSRQAEKPSFGSTSGSNKVARHRSSLACDICRSRRTKCDGRRPACSFCEEHDIPCNYRRVAAPGPSKYDMDIATIRERLDHICSLLSVRRFDGNTGALIGGSQPPFGGYPMDESIISRNWRNEFPFMTIQTPSTMILVRLSPTLAAQLVTMERTDVSLLTPPDIFGDLKFQYGPGISAFMAFCNKVHYWYPVLGPEFFNLYHDCFMGDFLPSSDSCLVLLVAAIGSVAQCSSITTALKERPDAIYIRKALAMLPNVNFEFSLRSLQCLVLFSIYYKYIAKPCQAHDYALMASCKAQALFKCHFYDEDPTSLELVRRSFWSVLLIETELAYHIDMPESNIWKFDDRILLPDIHSTWHPISSSASTSQRLGLDLDLAPPPDAAKAYFLAEIAMGRMLRRCTASVTLTHADQEVYAPVIAAELAHQLDRWHDHLPPSIRFARPLAPAAAALGLSAAAAAAAAPPRSPDAPPQPGLLAVTRYLQAQFYSCRASIYWPAVYGVVRAGPGAAAAPAAAAPPPLLHADCARFYDAYAGFVASAAAAIPCCPINAWYLYASLFIVTLAAIEGARAPSLQASIPPQTARCFALAADLFDAADVVPASPSLRTLAAILRERVVVAGEN